MKQRPVTTPFFMVYLNTGGNPRVCHETYEKAAAEAERLVKQYPTACVFVTKAIAMVTAVATPSWSTLDWDEEDEDPYCPAVVCRCKNSK